MQSLCAHPPLALLLSRPIILCIADTLSPTDLDLARRAIFRQHGKTGEFDLIARSYANLLRRWTDL